MYPRHEEFLSSPLLISNSPHFLERNKGNLLILSTFTFISFPQISPLLLLANVSKF